MTWLIRAECASISGSINGRRCGASRKASRIFLGRALEPALPRMIPKLLSSPRIWFSRSRLRSTSLARAASVARTCRLSMLLTLASPPAHARHLGEAARVVAVRLAHAHRQGRLGVASVEAQNGELECVQFVPEPVREGTRLERN